MVKLEPSCPACGKLPSQHNNNECEWRFSPAKWERLPSINPALELAQRVIHFIKAKGITSRDEILKHNFRFITKDDHLTTILYILMHSGIIKEVVENHITKYQWTNIVD
jgi:predicted amidophosphoribosyltransferase